MYPRFIFIIVVLIATISFAVADEVHGHKFSANEVKDWDSLLKTLEVMKSHNEIFSLEMYTPHDRENVAQVTLIAPASNIELLKALAAQEKIVVPNFTKLRRTPTDKSTVSAYWGAPDKFQKELESQKNLGTVDYQKGTDCYHITGDAEVLKFLQYLSWAASVPGYDMLLKTTEQNQTQILSVLEASGIAHAVSGKSQAKGWWFIVRATLQDIQYLEGLAQKDLRDYIPCVIHIPEDRFRLMREEIDRLVVLEEALWPVISQGTKTWGLFKADVFEWLQAWSEGGEFAIVADIDLEHSQRRAMQEVQTAMHEYEYDQRRLEIVNVHTKTIDDVGEGIYLLLGYTVKAPSYIVKRLQELARAK